MMSSSRKYVYFVLSIASVCASLVARPFSPPAPSRTLALVARRTSPRRREADLLADFLIDHRRRSARVRVLAPRRRPPRP